MIYKDIKAIFDRERVPGERSDPCINCGNAWLSHNGWSCQESYSGYKFNDIPWEYRFLTNPMRDSLRTDSVQPEKNKATSICEEVKSPTESKDIPEWKISRNLSRRSGECPCGLIVCEYHP